MSCFSRTVAPCHGGYFPAIVELLSRLDLRYIGTSRITINKILQKWKHQRLFAFSNRSPIHITDIDKLREIINISELTQIL
ncbi:helix-turn-helix domain-containing protein [Paenibacillus terrigena]|uniref:helix-turn-helix domain-containing protein n=1 Tax=Paenibacillus terrigena TaxID=369333 RepID=UPI0028D77A69|nr:helix-turn-helix domain-containing protein [Paenibacillus terrigena]